MPNFTCPNCNLNIYACTENGCCNNCAWNWTNREAADKKVTVITTQPKNGQTGGNDGLATEDIKDDPHMMMQLRLLMTHQWKQ